MPIGKNIKKYRKEKNITQKDLAEIINKKEITVRKYESGDISPGIDVLKKIAEALEINFLQLITGEETPDDEKKAAAIFEFTDIYENFDNIIKDLNLDLGPHLKETFAFYPFFRMSQEFLVKFISYIEENDKSTIEGLEYITIKELDYFLTMCSKYIQYLIQKHSDENVPDSEKMITIE